MYKTRTAHGWQVFCTFVGMPHFHVCDVSVHQRYVLGLGQHTGKHLQICIVSICLGPRYWRLSHIFQIPLPVVSLMTV
jgi:hypothetical protein